MTSDERVHQIVVRTVREQMPNRVKRTKSHFRGTSAGEETKNHLFPKPRVVAVFPNIFKFSESRLNLADSLGVGQLYTFNRQRMLIFFHE